MLFQNVLEGPENSGQKKVWLVAVPEFMILAVPSPQFTNILPEVVVTKKPVNTASSAIVLP
jgi:hypothetical protein